MEPIISKEELDELTNILNKGIIKLVQKASYEGFLFFQKIKLIKVKENNNNTALEIKEKILDFFFGVKEISKLNNEEEYGSKDKPN